ncbi:hypothetical protein, partial [Escherichia coli]|uniref:hypothetical protein n=1 Tax=Escherichia coli TaxID=562 RepID=UPI00307A75ED
MNTPHEQSLTTLCNDIIGTLAKAFHHHNLTLKLEETWYSTSLFCYQRKYYFKGLSLDIGNKHANKAFSGTSDMDTGLSSQISTAMQSGISLVESTVSPVIGPLYALVEGLNTIIHHPSVESSGKVNKVEMLQLTLLPSELGGFPFLLLHQFLYTGHKDTATETLSFFSKLWKTKPHKEFLIRSLVSFKQDNEIEKNLERLVMDPTSLCIQSPISAEAIMKGLVEDQLRSNKLIKNIQIKDLIGQVSPFDRQQLVMQLTRIRPIHLSLLHSFFEVTAEGQMLAALNRFTTVASLIRFTNTNRVDTDQPSYRRILDDCDGRKVRWIKNQLSHPTPSCGSFT